ncbi:MAG: glycosyltransferase family 4 protein [Ferruginibacter sp.]
MKVALITSYSLDATMPLTKYLAEENLDVHMFAIMPGYNQNVYVVDFSTDKQPNGFVSTEISDKKMGKNLCQYLSRVKNKFYVYPIGAGKRAYFQDIYYAWKFSRYIIEQKFDVVHLIHTANRFSLLIMHFLKKENLVQTLHEVTAHTGDTSSYNVRIMKVLIKMNTPIIFHSQVSRDRFIKFRATITSSVPPENLFTIIRFSLHETYLHVLPDRKTVATPPAENAVPIILHIGRVQPYKGIDILVDAVKILQKTQPVHLIVAGGGDPYFTFDGIDSYEFRNYAIGNEELIDLVKNCTLVVCPYRSASQSGIPMTVFPFNKPVVASNTGAFSEVIKHNVNGILVDNIDAPSFATAIGSLITNKEQRERMIENTKDFMQGEFSWSNIAKQTKAFYQAHYPENSKK